MTKRYSTKEQYQRTLSRSCWIEQLSPLLMTMSCALICTENVQYQIAGISPVCQLCGSTMKAEDSLQTAQTYRRTYTHPLSYQLKVFLFPSKATSKKAFHCFQFFQQQAHFGIFCAIILEKLSQLFRKTILKNCMQ